MSLQVNPGPIVGDMLYIRDNHRSFHLFNNDGVVSEEPLDVRRGDQKFFQYLQTNNIHPTVRGILDDAGFGGVIDCGYRTVDHALITALVERWRPETHTFHLTFGEATITLQDVNILWGLPIEGDAVTGVDYAYDIGGHISRCEDLLGFTPLPESIRGGRIKLVPLLNELKKPFPDEPTDLQCTQRARLIMMILFGGTLFPDTSNNKVPLYLLNNIQDLANCGRLSWGSAVLASLYRNLCKATHPNAIAICGPVYLLQLWVWERFVGLAPNVEPRYTYRQVLGARWTESFSYRDTPRRALIAYRSQLQSLRDHRFNWTPYITQSKRKLKLHVINDQYLPKDGTDLGGDSGVFICMLMHQLVQDKTIDMQADVKETCRKFRLYMTDQFYKTRFLPGKPATVAPENPRY